MAKNTNWGNFIDDESSLQNGNDIPKYMLHTERQDTGVFFGTKRINDEVKYVGKSQDSDGHVLVIGGAGSGKSSCIAIPTLETWGGTIFCIDVKGELTDYWDKIQEPKRPAKVFNLTKDQGIFASYDPFRFLRKESEKENLVQNAREIAHAIIPLPPNVTEPFWIQSAQHVLTAAIIHGCDKGVSFNATMTHILTVPIWELIDEIDKKGGWAAKLHVAQFKGIKNPADNKMMTGISAELCNRVMVFVTNLPIKDAFTPSEDSIGWDDLESHNIFMRIPEDKLEQWDGAFTLMLTQLIRSLERRRDKKYYPDGKPHVLSASGDEIPPTLLLLDEFPRLGRVNAIQNAVSTLRSKGITICLIMQSLAQLDRTYGKETRQIIVDNCPYKAILQVTDPENQKIFSDMIGTIKVTTSSFSVSRSESTGESVAPQNPGLKDNDILGYLKGQRLNLNTRSLSHSLNSAEGTTVSITETREPAIHPHKLAVLKDIALMTPEGFCRVDKKPYYPIPNDERLKPTATPKTTEHRKGMNIQGIRTPLDPKQ